MRRIPARGAMNGDDSLLTPSRKPKLAPQDYAKRFAAEKALQQRRYCDAFGLWRACALKACLRNAACRGDANRCLKRAIDRVPHRAMAGAADDSFGVAAQSRRARTRGPAMHAE